jgi:hypothetical protein
VPVADIYLSPLVNPALNPKSIKPGTVTALQQEFSNEASSFVSTEAKTLKRWFERIQPKCVVTFSSGNSWIRHQNLPPDLVEKLGILTERGVFACGSEPLPMDSDGNAMERPNIDQSFGAWAASQGCAWIDFALDTSRKNFDEVREQDWKSSLGPALKWLLEGPRFAPPKEPEPVELPKVIPALEMPPEFANL